MAKTADLSTWFLSTQLCSSLRQTADITDALDSVRPVGCQTNAELVEEFNQRFDTITNITDRICEGEYNRPWIHYSDCWDK